MFGRSTGGIKNKDWGRLKSRIQAINNAYSKLEDTPDKLAYFAEFRLEEFAQGIDLPDGLIDAPVTVPKEHLKSFRLGIESILKTRFFDCDYIPEFTRNGYYEALDWCALKEKSISVYDNLFEAVSNIALLFLHYYQGLPATSETKGNARLLVTVEDDYLGDKTDTIMQHHVVLDKVNEITGGVLFPNNDHAFVNKEELSNLPLTLALTRYTGMPQSMFSFLNYKGSYEIPAKARFEHTHIMASSGHGKTQLIENFIYNDIMRAHDEKMGLCVIDGQSSLIRDIKNTKALAPLQDRVVIIDPADIDHPFCLNPFDIANTLKGSLSPVQKQEVYANAIYLLEYVFSSLGASLTAKQRVLFANVVELLVSIEGATLLSMKQLLEDSGPFIPYLDNVDDITKDFFVNQFDTPTYADTKFQVLTRLYTILKTPALARMFTAKTNQLDLYEEMNRGAIILVDTNKSLLKDTGHSLLGRYFVALIMQSAFKRSFIEDDNDLTPCYVYIDECHDYLDGNIETMLEQARKFKVGMVLAHQQFDQLETKLRASIKTNHSVGLYASLSYKDRTAVSKEMGVNDEDLNNLNSIDRKGAEYMLKVKGKKPVKVFTPFGIMKDREKLNPEVLEHIVRMNRERYCSEPDSESFRPVTQQTAPEIATGGQQVASKVEKPATPEETTGFNIDDVEEL